MINRPFLTFGKSLSLAILVSSLLQPVLAETKIDLGNNTGTGVLKLSVIDGTTNKPVTNRPTQIDSQNGIDCIKAPCPTNSKHWEGRTNRQGIVFIPQKVVQSYTLLTVKGYTGKTFDKDLRQSSEALILLTPASP
ncbi:hypothetical protein [Chamaesiphon sp. VAR_48_metabat_135_sub]|uniref:hypothetical protein n=1 Tax=Chamaesiphon sp. VAR_48_metabat_135_sub TaxID=2964699 RepID=UPI00286C853B|nr:hypothetical protein [Chamaesiphon sp. VAR_48_metabat_135_sub]